MNWQTELNVENFLHNLPAGKDPFAYTITVMSKRLSPPLTTGTISMLGIFLLFHLTIAGFCLIILLLPFIRGAWRSQWFWRKLYIRDEMGESVYKTPLYFTNASILMTFFQLMSSIFAQVYIWLQIESAVSKKMLRSEFILCLGLMNLFEMHTYWSMTHCFLVTCLCAGRVGSSNARGMMAWITTPVVMNFLLICFPVCVTVTIGAFTWITVSVYLNLMYHSHELIGLTREGSLLWNRLQSAPSGTELLQLAELGPQIRTMANDTTQTVQKLIVNFRSFQSATSIFFGLSCITFMYSFAKMAQKYQRQAAESNGALSRQFGPGRRLTGENRQEEVVIYSSVSKRGGFRALVADQQFLQLALRALAILVGMLISISSALLSIINSDEVVTDIYWRGVGTSLATVGSACTAFPIAWQCWRSYVDQTHTKTARSTASSDNIHSKGVSILDSYNEPKDMGSERHF